MSLQLINIILGMKIRQARLDAGLTMSEFANACGLSPSYVTEIEKGRKYPRSDKIIKMADAVDKSYDDLVSIKLPPSLTYLESTLSSSVVQRFPFDEFGFEAGDLVNLLTRKPDKASALLHAVLEMIRSYDLKEEEFLRAALRSYQEMHENYFPELEEAVTHFTTDFGGKYQLTSDEPVALTTLKSILKSEYNYKIDDEKIATMADLAAYRSIYIPGKQPVLHVNNLLYTRQLKFIVARELGYQFLGLEERSHTSTPDKISSFQQLLNDYKAAYFGGALLMRQEPFLKNLQEFFSQTIWRPDLLLAMLSAYNVTPEMLLYRLSELVPQFFGLKIHFLRFHHTSGTAEYQLIKRLNMNHLLVPSGIALNEHSCRRWLSIRLLRESAAMKEPRTVEEMPIGVQLSEFLDSRDQFLSIGFARRLVLSPDVFSSVVIGIRLDDTLKHAIHFVKDPLIPHVIINETCERCPLHKNQCDLRAAGPTILQAREQEHARKLAIDLLREH